MFLVLVYPNGKCVDDRVWKLEEAKAAMRALVECDCDVHLAVITMRSGDIVYYGVGFERYAHLWGRCDIM